MRKAGRNLPLAFRVACSVMALAAPNKVLGDTPRTILPVPIEPFAGVIKQSLEDSVSDMPREVLAPTGAPHFFVFLADDVGFSMSSTFGGPVPTPNMDRLAKSGLRYNRFHTTGICSPSRAALLTGRNHHNAATGHLADLPMGFPGYTARIPRSTASIAEVLRLNGYNTAMFGKHHNVPPGEQSVAGPFDRWPTGLGFEYFFGIINGESDQWHPVLYRGNSAVLSGNESGELLEKRLVDDAISWVRDQRAAAPEKPFLVYYSSMASHAPHQAPTEFIQRFRGKFDHGWDRVREETWQRQLALGVIPKGTILTPRPASIAAWSSLSPVQKAFAARGMEVAAAMLAYQDEQLGRILDEFDRMGLTSNTLFLVVQGDNGASGDGDVAGVVSEFGSTNGLPQDAASESWMNYNIDKLGGEETYSSYAEGWGWAMNAPFPWYKMHASMLGGIRDGLIASWQGKIARPGAICAQFGHLVDIAPTILRAAKLQAPEWVNGVEQKPLDGESLVESFSSCDAERPRTQYFEIGGRAGLYHNGWFLANQGEAGNATKPWELYDLRRDFSQSRDIASDHPAKVAELTALWRIQAERNNVFPIRKGLVQNLLGATSTERKTFEFWGRNSGIPAHPEGLLIGRAFRGSFSINAEVQLTKNGASGVVAALGSHFAGWTLHLDNGRPVFTYVRSTRPEDLTRIAAESPLPIGTSKIGLRFTNFGKDWKGPARAEISVGDKVVAAGEIPATFFIPLGTGERLDIGRDTGVKVTDYPTRGGAIEGEVPYLKLNLD